MKTFGRMIALVYVLFNSACEQDDFATPPTPAENWKSISIRANLAPEVKIYGDGTMYLRWSGKATSNLTDKLNLSLSHEVGNFDENEYFEIQGGSFNLWSDDYQHTLTGIYTGRIFKTNGQFVTEGVITVQSGTGNFANEAASLSFSIGRFIPLSYPAGESEIFIGGTLKVPGNIPEP